MKSMVKTFLHDTIAAIATAVGEGGIGIVRISGPEAIEIVERIFVSPRGKKLTEQKTYTLHYGHIKDPETGEVIDEVVVALMRSPGSFTREDVVEIHCHGGPVPLSRILTLVLSQGARLAEAGEFTKRAFLNGRIDLSQAEAVIDLIRAKTERSAAVAVGQLTGVLSQKMQNIRQRILGILARVEASIDFPEHDIEEMTREAIERETNETLREIDELLATADAGKILRDGINALILGKPNVGKSSLLNAVLRQKRAIVTDVPGTTRDIIEEYLNIRGIPVRIIDTAGIRETEDLVEKIGVERALEKISLADILLLVFDAGSHFTAEDRRILELAEGRKSVIVLNKSDLPEQRIDLDELRSITPGVPVLRISALHHTGIEELERQIEKMVLGGEISGQNTAMIANLRHKEALLSAKKYLKEVMHTLAQGMPIDLLSGDLQAAYEAVGLITGETVGDDLLQEIFSRFCIGK